MKGSDTLVFRTGSDLLLDIPMAQVRRIIQRCGDKKLVTGFRQPYNLPEHGWYHHTRTGALIGQAYYGFNEQGIYLQHSSGWLFSRLLGAGIGAGLDYFALGGSDAATFPVFAEVRGYLLPRRVSPFYSLGAGWGFIGHSNPDNWSSLDTWKGGWMAQVDIGYRIGQHFTVNCGFRLQQKKREWTSFWGPEGGYGTDRILHKRLVLGLGLLL